ncbi:MAG: helix-turn-helix domain-containing protein [Chloroflexi bacterium]|jgi:excisionase family DNA binding protein|nr:helix-turn-helix domain-containing protein [Chloroflexota bacterium]MBT4072712.1 helix-turn-helix domain-containing protein [Chloroflexota bacterium]MBT4514219.1 helix-turn-helix domain-containing protein [Chloroflexota bacterium]MBT5319219.1 helix-turn-helix domain-containing protein [Chloroflexota bacterium]MBT6681561.1 helix-turn-helix domain-containing protein [Chloroflexota bacterium]
MASLKVRDVAARLNVSEKTVYKWLTQGLIPATKLGRTWVVTEESLDAVLATPGVASPTPAPTSPRLQMAQPFRSPEVPGPSTETQELETLTRINALAEGAIRTGIDAVLLPRSGSDETKRAIGEALEEARGEVLLHGIGLREFFGDMDYTPVLRRMMNEDRDVSIRALLVHPLSDFAHARAVAEIGAQFVDESSFRAGPLFGDSWRSLNVISSLRRTAQEQSNASMDVRFADHWPSIYLLMTESCCFVETYHFGRPDSGPDGSSIDGLVPILKLSAGAPYYRLLRNHFDYVWGGTNPYISVQTLEEVAETVRVSL